MITTFILTIFSSFLNFLVGFLPTGSIPQGFTDAVSYFFGALNAFSYIFPVSTLFTCLLLYLAFDLAVLLWHLFNWVIKKIPGMQ